MTQPVNRNNSKNRHAIRNQLLVNIRINKNTMVVAK